MPIETAAALGGWAQWNQVYSIGTTTNNYVPTAWAGWNQGIYGATTQTITVTAASTVWYGWNQGYTQGAYGLGNYYQQPIAINQHRVVEITEEQKAEMARLQAIATEERKLLAEKQAAAKVKAKQILRMTLSKRQREDFEAAGTFELMVNERLYRIRPGCRVERLDPVTKAIRSYFCIHPANHYELPHEDVALSQKLLLEANEAEFLRLANETPAYRVA